MTWGNVSDAFSSDYNGFRPNKGVAEQYKVRVSPFAHILDPEGVVRAKGLVNDREGVEHLLSDAGMKHLALEKHLPVVAGAHG